MIGFMKNYQTRPVGQTNKILAVPRCNINIGRIVPSRKMEDGYWSSSITRHYLVSGQFYSVSIGHSATTVKLRRPEMAAPLITPPPAMPEVKLEETFSGKNQNTVRTVHY